MKLSLRLAIDEGTTWHITLKAENEGEQAILHLLNESKELFIERSTDIHYSHGRTSQLTLFPKK